MKEYAFKILLVIAAVTAPIHSVMLACGFLILADWITGMVAARKRKESITSATMRRTISKIVVYQFAIMSAFVMEVYMLDAIVPATKIVAGVIGLVEFKSILENASSIAGKDILKLVLQKLGTDNDKGSDK